MLDFEGKILLVNIHDICPTPHESWAIDKFTRVDLLNNPTELFREGWSGIKFQSISVEGCWGAMQLQWRFCHSGRCHRSLLAGACCTVASWHSNSSSPCQKWRRGCIRFGIRIGRSPESALVIKRFRRIQTPGFVTEHSKYVTDSSRLRQATSKFQGYQFQELWFHRRWLCRQRWRCYNFCRCATHGDHRGQFHPLRCDASQPSQSHKKMSPSQAANSCSCLTIIAHYPPLKKNNYHVQTC